MNAAPVKADPELLRLLEQASVPTEAELREQRISFAYGNATHPRVTKDSVRRAARRAYGSEEA